MGERVMVSTSTPVMAATFSGGYSDEDAIAEPVRPDGGSGEVIVVLEPVAPDDVHQPQRERGVGAGTGLDVPVGAPGGRAPVRVDGDDRRRPSSRASIIRLQRWLLVLAVFEPQLTMNLHFGTADGSAPRRPRPIVYS